MTSIHWALLVGLAMCPLAMVCLFARREAESDLASCPVDMALMVSATAWKAGAVCLTVAGLLLTAYGAVSTFVLR